jgi:fructosamine-3-kinase
MGSLVKQILRKNGINPIDISNHDAGKLSDTYFVKAQDSGYVLTLPEDFGILSLGFDKKERIVNEFEAYKLIRGKTNLYAPQVVGTDGKNYLLVEFQEGDLLGEGFDSKKAALMGQALAEIHSTSLPAHGKIGFNGMSESYSSWEILLQNVVESLVSRLGSSELVNYSLEYVGDEVDSGQLKANPVLCHGDYHQWNLQELKDGSIGILDCEFSFAGSKEYDITRFLMKTEYGESFLSGYRSVGDVSGLKEKMKFYETLHSLILLADGKAMNDKGMIKENKARLRQLHR